MNKEVTKMEKISKVLLEKWKARLYFGKKLLIWFGKNWNYLKTKIFWKNFQKKIHSSGLRGMFGPQKEPIEVNQRLQFWYCRLKSEGQNF